MTEFVTGSQAAVILGVPFSTFKVAIYRGLGLCDTRAPQGCEAKPIDPVNGWSSRKTLYSVEGVEHMKAHYRWRSKKRIFTKEDLREDDSRRLNLTLEPWVYLCMKKLQAAASAKKGAPSFKVRDLVYAILKKGLSTSNLVKHPDVQALMQKDDT